MPELSAEGEDIPGYRFSVGTSGGICSKVPHAEGAPMEKRPTIFTGPILVVWIWLFLSVV